MIRVLHVVGKMHYGGMETLIMNIYRHIDRSKVQFDFLVHYEEPGEYDEEIRELGGKIFVMPKTVPQNYFIYKKALFNFFTEHQEYKIIHGHLQSVAFLYHKIAKKTGDRCCITHSHASGYDKNLKGIFSYLTALLAQNNTDVFFGCSNAACEAYFKKAIKSGKKMTVIKNGIDSSKYIFNSAIRKKVREENNLGDALVVGHTGRLSPAKNHVFLLKIFNEILKRNENSILLLAGDGPLKDAIRETAEKMNIYSNIRFLGARSDINELLQAEDIFVLPSLYEGLGIALIEAQAAGLKCFASTAVPQDANITDLLNYIRLEKSPEYWAEEILKSIPYERINTNSDIVNSGFDIAETAKELEAFYLKASELEG